MCGLCPIPLPELPSYLCNSTTISDAYAQILSLERDEQAAYNHDKTDDQFKRLMYARIVGYLILEGPSDQACTAVALDVVSCNNDKEKLLAIGEHYYYNYLCAFRQYKSHTPPPSEWNTPPSPHSFDTCSAMMKEILVEAPQNHKQAKRNALVRDGFRCILTGRYALASFRVNREVRKAAEKAGVVSTSCAQIFPESIIANIAGDKQGDMCQYAAGVHAILDHFGYKRVLDGLSGSKIHCLENVFTLCHGAQEIFNTLELWFEPTNVPNTYNVCTSDHCLFINSGWNTTVTFTTPDPIKLPIPSQDYLELHAACCRIAHLSGAGDYIDRILRKIEDIEELSPDGTSAEVLQLSLLLGQPIPVQ